MRVLDLWSYCSMGRLDVGCLVELDSADFLALVLCPFLGRATKVPREAGVGCSRGFYSFVKVIAREREWR
jgi:hypothetical protein